MLHKLNKLIVLILMMGVPAEARVRFWNYCQQGGTVVSTASINSANTVQGSYPGCTVTVYDTGTSNLAPIYSDNNGTSKANPFTADSTTGYYFYYADNGTYDDQLSGAGFSTFTRAANSGIDPFSVPNVVVYDSRNGSLAGQCTLAINNNLTLEISSLITGLSTQTLACPIWFLSGGRIQPASGQTVTLSGTITATPGQKIFDLSAGGTVTLGSSSLNPTVYPEWWGAVGDGTTDDYAAIQGAINAVSYGTTTISTGFPKATVQFSCKAYAIKTALTFFVQSGTLAGCGRGAAWNSLAGTLIVWAGTSTTAYALTVGGFYSRLQNMSVVIGNGTGWAAGIDYEGSQGIFDYVSVDCGGLPGNGVTGGAENLGQADQLELLKFTGANCWNGAAIKTTEGNALSWHLTNPSIYNNLYAIQTNTSTNLTINGGEFDYNGINFFPGAGSTLNATGWRSEGSRRGAFNGGGSYSSPITFSSVEAQAQSDSLATVTATCTATQYTVVLSGNTGIAPDTAFMQGDYITIAGAGTAGATLHTQLGVASTDNNHFALGFPCATSVAGAAVALDNSNTIANQAYFSFNGSGPYIIENSQFGHSATASTPVYVQGGNITLQNNAWDLNVTNPFYNGSIPSTAIMTGNVTNCNSGCSAIPNVVNASIANLATANVTTLNVSGVTTPTTIGTGTVTPTNVAGTSVLNGSGAFAYTFTGTYTYDGICIAQDYQASPVVITPSWSSVGGTYTVTFTATTGAAASGHAFGYHCIMTK